MSNQDSLMIKCYAGCGVRIRLPNKGDRPGRVIKVTCPKCGKELTTVIPGDSDIDRVLNDVDDIIDRVRSTMRKARQ